MRMTWDTFTKAIKEVELQSGTRPQILRSLFIAAGYISSKEDELSEATTKSWIKGDRKCKVSSYFPNGKLENPEGAYNFFRNRPIGKLKKLQQIFKEMQYADSPIDCETNDMDRFCWSLVNQFLDILGLQRRDIPASDTQLNLKINSIAENESGGNIGIEHSPIISQKELLPKESPRSINTESQISIPQDCRVCFCCKHWNGEIKTLCGDLDDSYGECKVLGERVLATDGIDCDKFKENYNKITLYDIYRKNGFSI